MAVFAPASLFHSFCFPFRLPSIKARMVRSAIFRASADAHTPKVLCSQYHGVLSRHPKRFLMLPASTFSDTSAGHLALSFQCSKCRGGNGWKFTQKASQFAPSMVKSPLITNSFDLFEEKTDQKETHIIIEASVEK